MENTQIRCGNAPRTCGDTAAWYAFIYGHTDSALGFVPYLKPVDLSEALIWVAEGGKSDIVPAILDKQGRIQNMAADKHDLRLFQKPLSCGADTEIRSKSAFRRHGTSTLTQSSRIIRKRGQRKPEGTPR